jgi:hypothetical protein
MSSVPEDIKNIVFGLKASIPERSTMAIALPTKTVEAPLDILHKPIKVSVKGDYVSRKFRGVLAECGDSVIIFAYATDKSDAVAYNLSNRTAGRLPARLFDYESSELFLDSTMYQAISDNRAASRTLVGWTEGDYNRVWNKENQKNARCSGFCFVLATGAIGRFSTTSFSLSPANRIMAASEGSQM